MAEVLKTMSIDEAAKTLRDFAELTARHSQNWDNFQAIARDMLKAAYECVPTGKQDG